MSTALADVRAAYQRFDGFASADEVAALRDGITAQPHLFTAWSRRGQFGPRYRVIDGEMVSAHLPAIERFGLTRVLPAVEAFAGRAVQVLGSPRRAVRVQHYRGRDEGFRWHFDGHTYAAIMTLENTNHGETQVISLSRSRMLRAAFYPLYAVPQVFSIVPHEGVPARAGDLVILEGRGALHRGVTLDAEGDRLVLVYAFDEAGRRVNRVRDRIAQWLNY